MAQPTNTFDSNDAVGNREDLYNTIYNVDPDDTPLLTAIPKVKATATYHEWQTDGLDTPSAANAQVEGNQVTHTAVTPTVRLGNYTQIFRKDAVVTDTQNAVSSAGRGREPTYQKLLKGKAIKNDIESSLFANNARVAGNSTTARELAGIPTWLTSNTSAGTGGSDATGDGSDARTNGTPRAFTEVLLKAQLASIYDSSGKKPDVVFLGSFNKQAASSFVGASTRFDKGEDKKLTASVDVYEYDFGSVRFEPARHMAARDALILCTEMWALAELQPMYEKALPENGDYEAWAIYQQSTLVCRNEKANGGVFDLTDS